MRCFYEYAHYKALWLCGVLVQSRDTNPWLTAFPFSWLVFLRESMKIFYFGFYFFRKPWGEFWIFFRIPLFISNNVLNGWGSKFGTTKYRTADILKIRNFEYWNNESRVIRFFILKFISCIYVCLNFSNTQNIW